MPTVSLIPVGVVLTAALIAAVTDLWKFKVYNALTLPMLASGLIYHGLSGGSDALGSSLLGMLFGFASLVVVYAQGGMGAGDVKLMAAVGAWLGMPLTFYVFIASALAGGVYVLGLLLVVGGLNDVIVNFQILLLRLAAVGRHLGQNDRIETAAQRSERRKRLVPFAAMIAVGIVATLFWVNFKPQ
jgi:prepilin peptidase CpaA